MQHQHQAHSAMPKLTGTQLLQISPSDHNLVACCFQTQTLGYLTVGQMSGVTRFSTPGCWSIADPSANQCLLCCS